MLSLPVLQLWKKPIKDDRHRQAEIGSLYLTVLAAKKSMEIITLKQEIHKFQRI